MEQILALAKKAAKEAEVFEISSEETQVRFESNRLKQMQTNQSTSVALRVIKDGRIGFATTTGTADRQQLVKNPTETASLGSEAKFLLPGDIRYPKADIFDPS